MSSPALACKVIACGAWGPGFGNYPALIERFVDASGAIVATTIGGPKPEVIPANERRRAPLSVRLAVESSLQATQTAGIDPKELSCVFVSGFGDTQLTDYMCKVLATNTKQLSPTKFHNSVHNAAAGYWTISTGCERSANSLAGFQESVPLALMEAVVQCCHEATPVLITIYDTPVSDVLKDVLGNGSSFSFSMIIAPEDGQFPGQPMTIEVLPEEKSWPKLDTLQSQLQDIYSRSPAGRVLAIVEKLLVPRLLATETKCEEGSFISSLAMPMAKGTSLYLSTNIPYEN